MKITAKFFLTIIVTVGIVLPYTTHAQEKPKDNDTHKYRYATFAAGCFWCEEYVFESVKGVNKALPGYAGGTKKKPTYDEVSDGKTGHAESVNVYYDSNIISYPTLLKVFFASQDPTQINGQGPDEGTEYRSLVFYRNDQEKLEAEQYIQLLNKSGKFSKPIATQIIPFQIFWPAESYHVQYIQHHPKDPYVLHESIPRIKRFQAQFPALIKPDKVL